MAAQALFTVKSLAELDNGEVAKEFESELRRIGQDCVDRPAIKKPRTVTLKVTITPKSDSQGNLNSISSDFSIASKMPGRTTRAYELSARKTGQLVFTNLYPDDEAAEE